MPSEPFIPLFKVFMPPSVDDALLKTIHSGYIGEGPRVAEFDAALTARLGMPTLALNSCTSALQLALRLAGVEAGDTVISTPVTCTATNEVILAAGAKIKWADVDPETGNISKDSIIKCIRQSPADRIDRIVGVDWGGYPCTSMLDILDAAHSGPVRRSTEFVCYSFQAIKHMTTGDGGALSCADPEDYRRGKLLRWYGIDRDQPGVDLRCHAPINEWGYKFHMNDIAATIGLEQLKCVDWVIGKHRSNAAFYNERLKGLSGLRLPPYDPHVFHSHWLYTVLVDERDEFVREMANEGIMVSQVHVRNDIHPIFAEFKADLPGVDAFCRRQCNIPVGWWLTPEDRERIVDAVRRLRG